MSLSWRVLSRKRLRRLARRNPVSRARHIFMAAVAHNFREELILWASSEIIRTEREILYGTGTGEAKGILDVSAGSIFAPAKRTQVDRDAGKEVSAMGENTTTVITPKPEPKPVPVPTPAPKPEPKPGTTTIITTPPKE